MPQKRITTASAKALTTATIALILISNALAAPKYQVLHAFSGGKDGGNLRGSLLLDRWGDVYGTDVNTAFELTPHANGQWSLNVLHTFGYGDDGSGPMDGLIFDTAGNLYGTTVSGGTHDSGVAFELAPRSHGWMETVLYNFCSLPGCKDGGSPMAGLIRDEAGNLYGVGYAAFELSLGADGWTETVLHDFTGQHGDGEGAYAGLIRDAAGNLYGQTEMGGSSRCGGGCGTVYRLSPTADGKWKESILHRFEALWDGSSPVGPLLLDNAGNLYGTAGGGNSGHGVVFRLSLGADGRWRETVVYNIPGGANGDQPGGGAVMDKAGNLYGTTVAGGDPNCECGVVYKLAPQTGGKWKYTVLHRFTGYDGAQPSANVILDSKGNLYGTTITGGAGGAGVAFKLTP